MTEETEFLKKFVEIYSPYGKEEKVGKFLVKEMNSLGIKAIRDKAGNAIGEIGKGDKTIMFVGHMDVYVGEIPVKVKNNKLYGRGSVDAKGSMAAFIQAAARVKNLKDRKIVIVCCVEEEGPSSKGARYLMEHHDYNPDHIVIGEPSGWQNIAVGYKGVLSFDVKYEQDNFHYGATDKARVTDQAVRFCKDLLDLIEKGKNGTFFDSPSVEIREINSSNDGLREKCKLYIVVRIPPKFDRKSLEKWIKKRIGEDGDGEVKFTQSDPAVVSDFNSDLVKTFRSVIKKHNGQAGLVKKLGTSDMNIIAPFYKVPTIAYGPGDSKLDHTPNEHLDLEEYEKSIEVLREVLERV